MLARRVASRRLLAGLCKRCGLATDAVVVGAGHNGLVAAALLARQGLQAPTPPSLLVYAMNNDSQAVSRRSLSQAQVRVFEEKEAVGGACKTEYPFPRVPGLGTSTGAPRRAGAMRSSAQRWARPSRSLACRGVPAGGDAAGAAPHPGHSAPAAAARPLVLPAHHRRALPGALAPAPSRARS